MAISSPPEGLHLHASCLLNRRVTSSSCWTPLRRRLDAYTPTPATFAAVGLIPPRRPPSPPPGGVVPVVDGYFAIAWRLAPPCRPPTSLPDDIVPVQDGYFIINWRLASPRRLLSPLCQILHFFNMMIIRLISRTRTRLQ
uniref:Uncharacterized protein n=1 Tax=Oryza rufipogon TaxID=4529 RepID=A0A0E0MYE1_ORYRU